jgi:hypothetical protein
MEVKVFVFNDPKSAEKDINDWLQKNGVRIEHICQSQSEKNGSFVFTVSVFYKRG